MANAKYIRVAVHPPEGWVISWKFEDAHPDWTYRIEKSHGQEGPWEVAKDDIPSDTLQWIDRETPYRALWDIVYYKIKVFDGDGDLIFDSTPQTTDTNNGRIIGEMIRQREMLLYGANSHPGFFPVTMACYKRMINGTECTNCIDSLTGDRIISDCELCQGTGYLEGYSNPIIFNAKFEDAINKRTEIRPTGEHEELERTGWTSNWPILEPGDILVEKGTNHHWRVNNIRITNPNNVIVTQRFRVKFVDRQYIEHHLEFPEGAQPKTPP